MVSKGLSLVAATVFTLSLLVLSSVAPAQGPSWEARMTSGEQAYREGRYVDAERAFQEALQDAERLGVNDPHVFWPATDLAELYYGRGRYAEAEALARRALAIRERLLGPNDHDVAGSLAQLGNVLLARGNLAEAEQVQTRALAIVEKLLDPDTAEVATGSQQPRPGLRCPGTARGRRAPLAARLGDPGEDARA